MDNPRARTTTTRYFPGAPARTTAVIRTLPRGHRVVTHNGVRNYQPTLGSYQVVANPYRDRRQGWR